MDRNIHNDIIDGNVNQFDKKPNESHNCKANSSCHSNFLKFCSKQKIRSERERY